MDEQHQDQDLHPHDESNKNNDQNILKTNLDLDHGDNGANLDLHHGNNLNLDHCDNGDNLELNHGDNGDNLDLDHGDNLDLGHGDNLDLDHGDNIDLDDDHDHSDIDEKLDLDVDNGDLDHGENGDLDQEYTNINGKNIMNCEPNSFHYMDDDPSESYAVCHSKVADWLDRNTFIERNPSVKFACSRNQDPCQAPSSRRSVSTNQQPKLSIIGFRKRPVPQTDSKPKNNNRAETVRLFRNRSEPGRDYCLLITEPVSPRVSCSGRVGSVRVVRGRKGGVWRSFMAAFSNLLHTNRVTKVAA